MNAIDDIAQAIGMTRGDRDDLKFAHDVILTLFRSHQRTHQNDWIHDREENTYELRTDKAAAYVARDRRAKCWRYFVSIGGKTVCEGSCGAAEAALMICSVAAS